MKTRREIAEFVKQLKTVPCMDCVAAGRDGIWPTECMDFDHRPEFAKLGSIQSFWDDPVKLLAEIAKCDLVCSNCHRIRTKQRGRTDSQRESIRRNAKRRWDRDSSHLTDPTVIAKRLAATREAPKRLEVRQKNSEALKRVLRDPEVRAKRSRSQKARYAQERLRLLIRCFDRRAWYNCCMISSDGRPIQEAIR